MKTKLIISIFAIFFIVNSCNKDPWFGNTIVEGTVVEEHTGKPIGNIDMIIRTVDGIHPYYQVDTIYCFKTDENGYFFYKFKIEDDCDYQILVKDNGCHYFISSLSTNTIIEKEKRNEYNFVCGGKTNVVFHLINTYPFDENDKISFFYGYEPNSYPIIEKMGENVSYFHPKMRVLSYTDTYYSYIINKNNIIDTFKESILINSLCTIDTITINY